MKIIIENLPIPEIQGLKNGLANLNNTIVVINDMKAIYDVLSENEADLIILKAESINDHVKQALIESNIPTVIYGIGEYDDINLQLICIPHTVNENIIRNLTFDNTYILRPFADTIFYQAGVFNSTWESDILIINNYFEHHSGLSKKWSELTDYKIKHTGTKYVKTPSFVGMCSPKELMDLAQSAKVVICDNLTETYSLLTNRICCFPEELSLDKLKLYIENEKSRRKYIKEHRTNLLSKDTVYHRIIDIADKLKISEWTDRAKTLCKN